jgi:wobble nucleotide-excising tRNase
LDVAVPNYLRFMVSRLQAAKPPAPVIFDDPINSLDYKRLAEVVDRIAVLSETRQVIVFTHNIWFTTELLARFEKRPQDCSY